MSSVAKPLQTPSLPWKTRVSLALINTVTDACRRRDGTINRRLINFLDARANPTPQAIKGVKTADFSVDSARGLWIRVYVPVPISSAEEAFPVVVFFHGGGFAFLSAASKGYDVVCRRFARELRAVVVSVEYRLAPDHRFPAQYEDGFDVLRWVEQHPTFEGFAPVADSGTVFLAGDSAGANIAHHVTVRFCKNRGSFPSLRIIGVVSIQPFFGGEERTESETRLRSAVLVNLERTDWLWKAFLPEGSDRNHPAAYLHGAESTAEIAGLEFPATVVVVGGFDPLQDRQRKYAEWLRANGKETYLIEYENAVHAFYIFPELPESDLLIGEFQAFMKRQLSRRW
ncbi:probable carboxylesterase 18 [Aristolochia californica]|uniref:probable carboxylesterase 18 n=1 Tax=Aristolochia californica TaxID=171875 RepID=UPI0035D5D1BA